jgi:hypothetical protein
MFPQQPDATNLPLDGARHAVQFGCDLLDCVPLPS